MTFEEFGTENEKTMMLLPGTCCDWQTNFSNVFSELSKKYHLICVNYDGFDGSDAIFPDILTVKRSGSRRKTGRSRNNYLKKVLTEKYFGARIKIIRVPKYLCVIERSTKTTYQNGAEDGKKRAVHG